MLCRISGSHSSVNEMFALLECYAEYISSYRRFGTTYRLRLQKSSSSRKHRPGVKVYHSFFCISWTALPLKMGLTGCRETSVTTNLRYITNLLKERRSQLKTFFYQPFDYLQCVGRLQCRKFRNHYSNSTPVPVAARSKA
jgi:hypothetical protein